jgi:hypothetical protein
MSQLLLKCDFLTSSAGAVNGIYNRESRNAFFSGDPGFPSIPDGVAEIEELPLERRQGDCHRV